MNDKEQTFQNRYDEVTDNLALLLASVEAVAEQDKIKWTDVGELGYLNEQLKELVAFYCERV